jgi:hypothetical protein
MRAARTASCCRHILSRRSLISRAGMWHRQSCWRRCCQRNRSCARRSRCWRPRRRKLATRTASTLKKAALERAREAEADAEKQTALAGRRLEKKRELEQELAPLKVSLMELQEQGATPINDFKKISGGTSGNTVWPLWVTQLIIEMLINGTPPTATPASASRACSRRLRRCQASASRSAACTTSRTTRA